jgi:hypothetical protein
MELTEHAAPQPDESSLRTLRVTFSYEGNQVRMVSRQAVDMRPEPSDPVYDYRGQSGAWFEVRDATGRVLYRRVIRNPMPVDMEAPSGDPERPFTRVRPPERRGTFVLTMPNLSRAQSIVLYTSPDDDPQKPAREIGRFELGGSRPPGDAPTGGKPRETR